MGVIYGGHFHFAMVVIYRGHFSFRNGCDLQRQDHVVKGKVAAVNHLYVFGYM
jgi:hypothetical protein